MSRKARKIALIVAGSLAGLFVLLFLAVIIVVQTDWFRNTVREKIVSAVEDATGGKTEVGSFSFDWTHLRAVVRDFVLHGTEPAGAAPLFRCRLLEVDLKLTSPFHHFIDIAYLGMDTPQANVIVFPDGRTNVPAPKVTQPSDKSGLETIVDLAVGQFKLTNGSLDFAQRVTPFSATGRNLRAQLSYNPLNPSYRGEISMNPLLVQSGNNPPVNVDVKLPLVLEKDAIQLDNARLTTPESEVVISGAMNHLAAPQTSAQVTARLALDEIKRAAGLTIPLDTGTGAPRFVTADLTATMDQNRIEVTRGHIVLGESNVQASGTLKNGAHPAGLRFQASLALGQLGKLLRVSAQPHGTLNAGGQATLTGNSDYRVIANLNGKGIGFRQGATKVSGIELNSTVTADPRLIHLGGLRVAALGGSLSGDASLENMAKFHVNARLDHFDIQQVARALSPQQLAWDGVVSGPVEAEGDVHAPQALVAHARLSIAPGRNGIPVSGQINADYDGPSDTITLARSYVAMPSTRVDLSGTLNHQIQVRAVTHNLADLMPSPQKPPVTFQSGGSAIVNATVSGKLTAPRIAGHVAMTNFAAADRTFNSFSADLDASKTGAAVQNGLLARGALQARFSGSVGLRDWKPENWEPLAVNASIQNADTRDLLALAGKSDVPVSGQLTASAQITGTVGSPRGSASLDIDNGTAYDEHFDRVQARVNLTDRTIDLPLLQIAAGPARLDANATFQHPLNDLKAGSVRVHLASNQINLQQFKALLKDRPGLAGTVQITADAAGRLQPSQAREEFQLVSVDGNASARGLQLEGKNYGDFAATAQTAGTLVSYNVNSNLAGSSIKVDGRSELTGDHNTTATAVINNLPIERVLALAGRRDIPAGGVLSANAQLSGTLKDPHATGNLTVLNGTAYQEKFDRLQASFGYSNQLIDLPSLTLAAGPNRVEAAGSFNHPPNDLQAGQARFHLASNNLQLAQIQALQQYKPGLAGTVEVSGDGAATLRHKDTPLISTFNGNITAKGLSVNRKPLGDLNATARTSGNDLTFHLTSDIAKSDIRGEGRMQLAGDYPLTAQVTFGNVTYSGLSAWFDSAVRPGVDALVAGQINVDGPAAKPDALRGELRVTTLDVHSTPVEGAAPRRNASLRNAGPILVTLDRSVVRIQSARLAGPFTDLSLSGTAALQGSRALDLRADGSVHLELLEAFDADVFSSGVIALNAALQGTMDKPAVDGQLKLQNASFNMMGVPNGLSNANGTIVFNGTEARIENLEGESGGGKVTLAGFVAYGGDTTNFRLQATGRHVRVESSAGVSVEANANLTATGNTTRSLLSGTVTIRNVALHSHTDVGSILSQTATPPAAPSAQTGILGGMRFDVRIQTAPDVQFETTLAQNLQAEAQLTLRGTPTNPGMLGRVNVTEGEVVFFGYKYTIDQGSVGFYNPQKIEPVLNIDLETQAKGVTVSLSVSGPMDQLKLSYHSDPPLQFSDIVGLLATGKVPTTDPVLAANQPPAPQQSMTQMGASAVLGQAVANPVSGRLQRLFGVTQLKIDPEIIGATNTPQARLTLEQQITKQLDFIYIQDVTQSNPQVIRIEWDINPTWTAVAERDIYGEFGVDFFYKKRFR
ncbi:MAG: translocation/assembly module TamB domain-containing protein [Bryobacteraceae bacterium]